MKAINPTDFVLVDKANESVVCYPNGDIIIYDNYDDAWEDCYGNESVMSVSELPQWAQDEILKQLNPKP